MTYNTETYDRFMALASERYSCRKYLPTPVEREKLTLIMEAARIAPSACNRQPWQFLITDTPGLCSEVAKCYGRDWVDNVPAFIVACGEHDTAWHRADGKDHTDVDLSIAVEHICLAATALGLGSCWICNFDEPALRKALDIPQGTEPIAIIPIGYPDPETAAPGKKRKPMDEIVKWGKY